MSETTQTHHKTQTDPAAGRSVVSLRDVDFGYVSGRPVIRTFNAELFAGHVCALIGPNASGKSTLLKLILGQLAPWSGSTEVMGRPVAEMTYHERARQISYVPQRGVMSFAFTVRQVVAMGRYAMGDPAGHVDRALALCDLLEIEDRVFAELSGGQQQRVLLARAVAQSGGSGRVMLLDEPASGMDLKHVHQTMRLLREITDGGSGPAVLVVLHDVNLASRYADDVWLLDHGQLIASGGCQEVMDPERLASVYGVRFQPMQSPGSGNGSGESPVFWIDPVDIMD